MSSEFARRHRLAAMAVGRLEVMVAKMKDPDLRVSMAKQVAAVWDYVSLASREERYEGVEAPPGVAR